MDLDSTSSTQPPPDSSKLPPAIATRIPPELLLDIFSIVSDSPTRYYDRYLERNRNLKSFTLVHSAWKSSAQKTLQEEVYIRGTKHKPASEEEIERIASLLTDSKIQGTKYLTVYGHRLNILTAKSGYAMWSQVRYLKVRTSKGCGGSTRMSDFTPFPRLQEMHLKGYYNVKDSLCFDPSDVDLRFPYLRRITFSWDVTIGVLSQSGDIDGEEEEIAALVPITHKLFSPSNMPNLSHLALYGYSETTLPSIMVSLGQVLPHIATLAVVGYHFDPAILFPENRTLAKLRHLSLNVDASELLSLLNDNELDLESLHLSAWGVGGEKEVLSRLIKIAKGEDPKNRVKRIAIYGARKYIETEYREAIDELDAVEWREDREWPPSDDFDGR